MSCQQRQALPLPIAYFGLTDRVDMQQSSVQKSYDTLQRFHTHADTDLRHLAKMKGMLPQRSPAITWMTEDFSKVGPYWKTTFITKLLRYLNYQIETIWKHLFSLTA